MADYRSDLDKKVGNEPADIVPWNHDGAQWRPDKVPEADLLPENAMPLKETKKPFVIKGG